MFFAQDHGCAMAVRRKTRRRTVEDSCQEMEAGAVNAKWALQRALGALCALTLVGASACALRVNKEEIAPEQIETTLFLIGDAGEPNPRTTPPALDSLTAQASVAPARSIIVFLGDNVYPNGVPDSGFAEWADSRRRLAAQIDAVPAGARGIFLPGNHDWAGMGPFGLYSVRLQERMIGQLRGSRDVRMLPGNGCPGPVSFDTGRLRFIVLDTQWWLHEFIVKDAQSKCPANPGAVTAALREELRPTTEGRVTIVAGHHPLMTGGEHGGYCGAAGPFHRFGGSSQDILSSLNRTMRDSMESAFTSQPPLAYVAGHDHTLQVLKGGLPVRYLLVSGAGSQTKAGCAVRLRESYFVSQHRSGFMRVDVMRGKGVLLQVFHYNSGGAGGLVYSRWLELR